MSLRLTVLAAVAALASVPTVDAADPAVLCESGKLKTAGKYASCVLSADSKAAKTGGVADYSTCISKFGSSWQKSEDKGAGMCPGGSGDQSEVQDFLDYCRVSVADALESGTIPDCPADLATCDSDLTSCNGSLGACGSSLGDCESLVGVLKTGQTTCYNASGTIIACAGTGQDGDIQAGVARTFTDNGDGTITDDVTGLMWEKHSDDGTIHDKDNTYTWTNATATKVATLNSTNYAGHNDWRLPNVFEMASLWNLEPALNAYPEFDAGCSASCSVTTCSCTVAAYYWTSTTSPSSPSWARRVTFGGAVVDSDPKSSANRVRAVRGGISVPSCGNAIAEGFEQCDGIDLNGMSCFSLGYNKGGTLTCSPGCTYDTAACVHQAFPATGQTTSYGAGDDGDVEAGGPLTYVDNGDGTITDTTTGLMWEKKILGTGGFTLCASETGTCANPHHASNAYTWGATGDSFDGTVVTIFLEQLNDRCDQDTTVSCTVNADCAVPGGACGFAGHQDWRLPSVKELQSMIDYSVPYPGPTVHAAFDGASCGVSCTDVTDPACSCTNTWNDYWSSTTDAGQPSDAWTVYCGYGTVSMNSKEYGELYARAVRGGS